MSETGRGEVPCEGTGESRICKGPLPPEPVTWTVTIALWVQELPESVAVALA